MKSIFHSEKTVVVDGVEYTAEADETIEGTQYFTVTSESGAEAKCKRSGKEAYGSLAVSTTDEFDILEILEHFDEVDVKRYD